VYNDRVYTLVYGKPWVVNVHDLTGHLITSWTHTDDNVVFCNKLAVVDDRIVIPDRTNSRITIYSLTGEVIKHIPCPLLSASYVAMCAAGDHSVVVSHYFSSKVFKVNISTKKVSWTSLHIKKPQGVAYYKNRVYVINASNITRVWILDVMTGVMLTEISNPTVLPRRSSVFDLHIYDNIIMVPRCDESKVLFYQLRYM